MAEAKSFPIKESGSEERRVYVTGVVRGYLEESGKGRNISSEGAFVGEMVDLLVPIEMRFRGRWHDRRGEDSFYKWRHKVRTELVKDPQEQTLPEAQRLRQIGDKMEGQEDTRGLVLDTFNESLNTFETNSSSYREYREFKVSMERSRSSIVARSVSRSTRGVGIDVNPPSSKSQWRNH